MTGLLGAAVGVPYAVNNAPDGWLPGGDGAAAETAAGPGGAPPPLGPDPVLFNGGRPLEGSRFQSLGHVLRMDVTKDWVYRHWPRKSTGLADPSLFGVRVPLVTGAGRADLAGSLTYYFNAQGQVDRLCFKGTTGDTRPLVHLVQSYYGLQRQTPESPGEQLYQARSGDKVVSQLRTFPEPVLWSSNPHNSFGVELELNRPGSGRYVEPPRPQLDAPAVAQSTPPAAPEKTPAASSPASGTEQSAEAPAPKIEYGRPPEFRWPN